MKHSAELRRCLVELDVAGARRLWAAIAPHMPQPTTDAEALATMHHARSASVMIPFQARAYSHRWLVDNGIPSGLPDNLKPRAERLYPKIVEAVGIAVQMKSALLRPIAPIVERAMADAVLELYADSASPDPGLVRRRIQEARRRTVQTLIGFHHGGGKVN